MYSSSRTPIAAPPKQASTVPPSVPELPPALSATVMPRYYKFRWFSISIFCTRLFVIYSPNDGEEISSSSTALPIVPEAEMPDAIAKDKDKKEIKLDSPADPLLLLQVESRPQISGAKDDSMLPHSPEPPAQRTR